MTVTRRGAVENYAPWTPAEDATLRESYAAGGIYAARAALPHRAPAAIYRRAQRLHVARRRRWSDLDDARLRKLWDGETPLPEIATMLGRSHKTTYWRAQQIGLPLGVPEGWERLSHAGRRTGYHPDQLRRILAWAGVAPRRVLTRALVRRGRAKYSRPRFMVLTRELDAAIEAWHETEPLYAAARRVGVSANVLERRLSAIGVLKPEKKRRNLHWRVAVDDVERAMQVPAPRRGRPRTQEAR